MSDGTYTNKELIDTIIVDLNNLPGKLIAGQFIQFCTIVSQMGQKLINLRETIDADLKNREATIETLKRQLREMDCEVVDIPAEQLIKKDGAK